MEYNLFKQVLTKYKTVEITADFNTIRKDLGLPLSPFVTGGEDRYSSFTSIGNPLVDFIVDEADIPFYGGLGFSPDTINNFYSKDLVDFFKEKTIGKKDATVRKYMDSLYIIRQELERRDLDGWDNCTDAFWVALIEKVVLEAEVSKTFQKDFFSTIKALTKWLESKGQTDHSKNVNKLMKEMVYT